MYELSSLLSILLEWHIHLCVVLGRIEKIVKQSTFCLVVQMVSPSRERQCLIQSFKNIF